MGAITLKKVQHKLAGGTGGNGGGDWGQENGSGANDNRSSELPVLLPREVQIVTSRQWMVRRWWWLVKQPNTSPFQVSEVNDWKEVAA